MVLSTSHAFTTARDSGCAHSLGNAVQLSTNVCVRNRVSAVPAMGQTATSQLMDLLCVGARIFTCSVCLGSDILV